MRQRKGLCADAGIAKRSLDCLRLPSHRRCLTIPALLLAGDLPQGCGGVERHADELDSASNARVAETAKYNDMLLSLRHYVDATSTPALELERRDLFSTSLKERTL